MLQLAESESEKGNERQLPEMLSGLGCPSCPEKRCRYTKFRPVQDLQISGVANKVWPGKWHNGMSMLVVLSS